METLLGLIGMGLVWIGALCMMAWSWDMHCQRYLVAGIEISSEQHNLKTSTFLWLCVRSHTVGWTAFFFIFFALLGVADFPVWQRLGIGGVLALCYGYSRVEREREHPGRLDLFSPRLDGIWYSTIWSAEWLGYFGVLIYTGQLFVAAVG